ncbi:MAG: glycosyltransferase family 9 protein [Chloroflexota bacterium]
MDVLTSAIGAQALAGLDSIDHVFVADKHQFDRIGGVLSARALGDLAPLLAHLRARRYDGALLLHHLTTPLGTAKYLALTRLLRARRTAGLDNGRGWFLSLHVPDTGFGVRHEADYGLAVAQALGAAPGPRRLELFVGAAARDRATALLPEGKWIAMHPGGGTYSLARRWMPGGFGAVADELAERWGASVVLLGTDVDRAAADRFLAGANCRVLDLVGRCDIQQTGAVLERCELLVSNDSGVVHMAAAVGTPVVAVFGPSNARAWGPYPPERHRVVRTSLPCSPCFYRGTSLGTPGGCATRDCLRLLTPEMVVEAAEDLLAATPSTTAPTAVLAG